MRSRRRAVLLPDWREQNPYLDLLASGLERHNVDVRFADFDTGVLPLFRVFLRYRKVDVLHLHWVNDLIGPLSVNAGVKLRH
jgi:hypothetical protein